MSSTLHKTGHLFLVVIHRCILMAIPLYPFAAGWQHLGQSLLSSVADMWVMSGNQLKSCITPVASFLPAYGSNANKKSSGRCWWVCLMLSQVGVHGAGELAA